MHGFFPLEVRKLRTNLDMMWVRESRRDCSPWPCLMRSTILHVLQVTAVYLPGGMFDGSLSFLRESANSPGRRECNTVSLASKHGNLEACVDTQTSHLNRVPTICGFRPTGNASAWSWHGRAEQVGYVSAQLKDMGWVLEGEKPTTRKIRHWNNFPPAVWPWVSACSQAFFFDCRMDPVFQRPSSYG